MMSECRKCEEPLDELELSDMGLCEICEKETLMVIEDMSGYNDASYYDSFEEGYDLDPDPQTIQEQDRAAHDLNRRRET